MTPSMSKRQQARNEQDLQHLIISVAGNDRCADCQARNPGWASWNLGIFLCMRCAAIHRKLGTHISKVKSLSMDTWRTEQVDKMRENGNASVNKIYNPKNIKPGIPIDVDEVDSAMERFIRQKYQERSLANGRPRPPSRDQDTMFTRSQQPSPPPLSQSSPPLLSQLPKIGNIFGIKFRASSSAYPASKQGARNLPPLEPTVDNAFQAEVRANKPSKPRASNDSEKEKVYEDKLEALREMGFSDDERSLAVLKRLDGDLGRTIESLLRLGGSSGPVSRISTPIGSKTNTPSTSTFPGSVEGQVRNGLTTSQNPFNQPSRANTLTVPQTQGQHSGVRNPSDVQSGLQNTPQSINQAFQAMQVSQPLFPHSTGGYPVRQPPMQNSRFQNSMTPPIPHISQQYEYASSPSPMNNTNPFYQNHPAQGMSDSYVTAQQAAPLSALPSNPFFIEQPSYQAAQPPLQSASLPLQSPYSNPFGVPSSPQSAPALQPQSTTLLDIGSTFPPTNATQQSFYQQQNPQTTSPPPSHSSISPSQSGVAYQQTPNPYQPQPHPQQSPPNPFQPSPMRLQRTGRLDKQSILALYNHPHVAPQPMPTILDDSSSLGGTAPSNLLSSTSQQTSISDTMANGAATPARRSTTMPILTTSSELTWAAGSKNPFVSYNNNTPSLQSSAVTSPTAALRPTAPNGIMHRHVSQESVSIANLESGRHSPDAFANLSARFVRG